MLYNPRLFRKVKSDKKSWNQDIKVKYISASQANAVKPLGRAKQNEIQQIPVGIGGGNGTRLKHPRYRVFHIYITILNAQNATKWGFFLCFQANLAAQVWWLLAKNTSQTTPGTRVQMFVAYANTATHLKSPESPTRSSAANSVPMVSETAWLFVTMERQSAGSVVPFDQKRNLQKFETKTVG